MSEQLILTVNVLDETETYKDLSDSDEDQITRLDHLQNEGRGLLTAVQGGMDHEPVTGCDPSHLAQITENLYDALHCTVGIGRRECGVKFDNTVGDQAQPFHGNGVRQWQRSLSALTRCLATLHISLGNVGKEHVKGVKVLSRPPSSQTNQASVGSSGNKSYLQLLQKMAPRCTLYSHV